MSEGYAAPSHAAVEIEPDEEDDLVAISGHDSLNHKGKGRETLSPSDAAGGGGGSSGSGLGGGSARSASPNLSGKIGGSATGGSGSQKALRTQIAGLNIETRYSGVNSLDESVGESIVSGGVYRCWHGNEGACMKRHLGSHDFIVHWSFNGPLA